MRRNILHLVPSFHQGGSEKQALQLVRFQVQHASDNVLLACLDSEGILGEMVASLGFTDIPEFRLNTFYDLNAAVQSRRFVTYLKRNRIEVLQTHDFYTNVFGMIAGAAARVPLRIAAKRETNMRTGTQDLVERRAFRLAHSIVANSSAVKDFLSRSGVDERKIKVIYNGIDTDRFEGPFEKRNCLLESFGLPATAKRIVTIVANLREKVKNYPMFLDAAERIAGSAPDAIFVSAGEGPLLQDMRSLSTNLGLSDRMFFLGRCTRVPELLSVSDVCVLASLSEGFSNSILEYMAAGKPVVATDVGGAREAIIEGKTGYLIQSGDVAGLADRCIRLLSEPQRANEMGERGRARVKAEFSLEKQLSRTFEIYSERQVIPA